MGCEPAWGDCIEIEGVRYEYRYVSRSVVPGMAMLGWCARASPKGYIKRIDPLVQAVVQTHWEAKNLKSQGKNKS